MDDTAAKIKRLRELIAEQDAGQDPVSGGNIMAPPEEPGGTVQGGQITGPDPDRRPASLEGCSCQDIVLLETDGLLSRDEEDWFSTKSVPNPHGNYQYPNIKAILRRNQQPRNQQQGE